MKILEIHTKVKKQVKTIIYSSIILSIFVIIAGIFLLTFKEHIINYIEYFLLVFFIQTILLNLFLFWKYKRKIYIALVIFNIVLLVIFLILYFFVNTNFLNIIAYIMAISSIFNVIEAILELFEEKDDKSRKNKIISGLKIIIEIFFAVSLLLNKGDSVYNHLIIFGIVFIVKGVFSTLSIFISRREKQE